MYAGTETKPPFGPEVLIFRAARGFPFPIIDLCGRPGGAQPAIRALRRSGPR
jgi:hypothetical protein